MFLTFVHVQVVWLGTCIAAILLGLDLGLAAGLGVELLSVVLRTQLSVSDLTHLNLYFSFKSDLNFCCL